jgi:hypothetical protein
MRSKFILFLSAVVLFIAVACGGNQQQSAEETGQGPEYTSAYVCPMHCEGSGSDQAGSCPVCGMAYVANTDGPHADEPQDHHHDEEHHHHDGDHHHEETDHQHE